MKRNNKILVITLVGVLTLGTVSTFAATKKLNNNKENVYSSATPENNNKEKISKEEAKKIVSKDNSNIIVKEVDFEKEDGKKIYKVEVLENGKEKEYELDANTGKILKIEDEDNDYDEDEKLNLNTKISMNTAKEIVSKDLPNSKIIETELEREDGKDIFNIEAIKDNVKKEYTIDANTGKIIEVESKENNKYRNMLGENIKISLDDAEKIAKEKFQKGKIIGSKLKNKHSNLVYEIELIDNNTKMEFKIDANTGKILEIEK